MSLIEIKHKNTDKALHSLDCNNNTILITLKDGISHSADLRSANLHSANLRSADLRYADLRSADLHYANLPKTDIIINDRYYIHIRPDYIKIGCENHSPSWWKQLTFKKAETLENGAGDWWKQRKPVVLAIYEAIKKRSL